MMPPGIGENHSQAAHPLAGPITKRRSAANWKLRMTRKVFFLCKTGNHLHPAALIYS